MGDTTRYERIGSALHALAADLAAERRRASALRRENEKLSAQLEALKEELATSVARSKAGLAASVS
jgi:cell division protein FtsB